MLPSCSSPHGLTARACDTVDMGDMDVSSPLAVPITLDALKHLVEPEALRYLELVQAATATNPVPAATAISFPQTWSALKTILLKLAYGVDSKDPWTLLGVGPLVGPKISEIVIVGRARTGRILCTIADSASWNDIDISAVKSMAGRID